MATTLTATFDSRREAELTVERLVQEHGIDRAAISIAADGDENSAGTEKSGSDLPDGSQDSSSRDDAALTGMVMVVVDLDDDAQAEQVKDAFVEFNSAGVVEN
ncbi:MULTISPECIES: hypothetical protein [unclassified Sphingomonas]|uniref:hypothetical protein n=1 Tax=unclassified Sphingomonas TaxID=196159 RepID=UPI001F59D2EF|nr:MULTISPECIES: hypothetical protein [unclassified Sphingomonas]